MLVVVPAYNSRATVYMCHWKHIAAGKPGASITSQWTPRSARIPCSRAQWHWKVTYYHTAMPKGVSVQLSEAGEREQLLTAKSWLQSWSFTGLIGHNWSRNCRYFAGWCVCFHVFRRLQFTACMQLNLFFSSPTSIALTTVETDIEIITLDLISSLVMVIFHIPSDQRKEHEIHLKSTRDCWPQTMKDWIYRRNVTLTKVL